MSKALMQPSLLLRRLALTASIVQRAPRFKRSRFGGSGNMRNSPSRSKPGVSRAVLEARYCITIPAAATLKTPRSSPRDLCLGVDLPSDEVGLGKAEFVLLSLPSELLRLARFVLLSLLSSEFDGILAVEHEP